MSKNINKLIAVLFLGLILIACSEDSKSTAEPELTVDPDLVGTWVLTLITSPITSAPEDLGLSLTSVFNDDATFEFTTIQNDSTSIDNGTWGTKNGNITITFDGEDPITTPYSVDGNKATISGFPVAYNDNIILAGLEFTKQD
jgi:hypothetical protein